jgi:pimeloyl-ACP methyl ester carboxylesterase
MWTTVLNQASVTDTAWTEYSIMHTNMTLLTLLLAAPSMTSAAQNFRDPLALPIPAAVVADPAHDASFPARMEVIHVPSGGVNINGIVLVAAGRGAHPTFVLFHGLPGNEKNADIAQAVRRAGWTVVTVNYRGCWGSPGHFSFAQNLQDARATLSFIRSPANAAKLGIDSKRIAIGGHSMGGWVAAQTAAVEPDLLGALTISTADFGALGVRAETSPRSITNIMKDNMETLVGVTPQSMVDELIANGPSWSFATLAPKLLHTRLLVLYSQDLFKASSEELVAEVRAAGGNHIESGFVPTDHSWSDRRILLSALVVNWLQSLTED